MPAAEAPFMDHGERPDIADLKYKTASVARLDVYSENDGSERKGRDQHYIRSHLAAMPKQFEVKIKPAHNPSDACRFLILGSCDNGAINTID